MSEQSHWQQVTPVPLPEELALRYGSTRAVPVYGITEYSTTWQCTDAVGRIRYCKVARVETTIPVDLADEAERLHWCEQLALGTPRVVEQGAYGGVTWLVTEEVPGVPLHVLKKSVSPRILAANAGAALRAFHALPTGTCPWSVSPQDLLQCASHRVGHGLVDRDRDFHAEHAHLSFAEALHILASDIPDGGKVLTHGDFCFPNILLDPQGMQLSGLIDLGRVAVGDPWWDLAIGSWSVEWNLGPGYEEPFFHAYGLPPDTAKIAWYRLAYDLVA